MAGERRLSIPAHRSLLATCPTFRAWKGRVGLAGWTPGVASDSTVLSPAGDAQSAPFPFLPVWFPGPGDPQLVSCSENGPKLEGSTLLSEPWLPVGPSLIRGFVIVCQPRHLCESWAAVPGCLCLLGAFSDHSSLSRGQEWVPGVPSC